MASSLRTAIKERFDHHLEDRRQRLLSGGCTTHAEYLADSGYIAAFEMARKLVEYALDEQQGEP